MITALLFIAFFVTITLLLLVLSGTRDKERKETLSRLEAIRFGPQNPATQEENISVRREEKLGNIPWLDSLLRRLNLAEKLQLLLYQAELNWSPGRVILTALALGIIAAYLVYMRTGSAILAFLFYLIAGSLPVLYVFRQRAKRFDRMKERLPEALD